MKRIILESFKDDETGEVGLGLLNLPRDYTTNAAHDGMTIAHDIIEHVNGPEKIGTIDDELEALGAIWYVRGRHGEIRRDGIGSAYTPEQNIASDVVRMFRDHVSGGQYVHYDTKRVRACDYHDASLLEIVEVAERSYREEFNENERAKARKAWPAYAAIALKRMRTGYRKARRKWESRGSFAANNQFWAIADAVQPYAKRAELEGRRFVLTYGDGEAYCEEQYEAEGYE
jgi:hypothetical protein